MVGKTNARNQSQKIQTTPLIIRRIVSPFTFYTCPANKKAIIKGTAVCDSTGAAIECLLKVTGVIIHGWRSDIPAVTDPWIKRTTTDIIVKFEVQLAAGETLTYDQNTGTNASIDLFSEITETPA